MNIDGFHLLILLIPLLAAGLALKVSAECDLTDKKITCSNDLTNVSDTYLTSAKSIVLNNISETDASKLTKILKLNTNTTKNLKDITVTKCSLNFKDVTVLSLFENVAISQSKLTDCGFAQFKGNKTNILLNNVEINGHQGALFEGMNATTVNMHEVTTKPGKSIFQNCTISSLKVAKSQGIDFRGVCNLKSLKKLELADVKDIDFPLDCFESHQNLIEAGFSNVSGSFEYISGMKSKLEILKIAKCGLKSLNFSLEKIGSTLKTLVLRDNNIDEIKIEDFKGVANLKELDLQRNNLTVMPQSLREFFSKLDKLKLGMNSLVCNCSLYWLGDEVFSKFHLREQISCSNNTVNNLFFNRKMLCPSGISPTVSSTRKMQSTSILPPVAGTSVIRRTCSVPSTLYSDEDTPFLKISYKLVRETFLILACSVYSLEPLDIHIYLPNQTLVVRQNIKNSSLFTGRYIHINMTKADRGCYVCVSVNENGFERYAKSVLIPAESNAKDSLLKYSSLFTILLICHVLAGNF